jgi:hypothetical protein
MPRLRVLIEAALLVGITAGSPAMAQTGPHASTPLLKPIAPPVGLQGLGSQPDAVQQSQLQNYGNQLDERQRTEQFMTGPLAAERQMRTQQRLDQFSLTQGQMR